MPPLKDLKKNTSGKKKDSVANRSAQNPGLGNGLIIQQPEDGYRFSLDPLILCSRVRPRPGDHILDLGCGCGIMPLVLGDRYPRTRITGIEIQQALSDLATRNVSANRMHGRIRILNKDINRLTLDDIGHPADIIISNPPYKKKGTGRMNPNMEKAIARHEILVTIDQIFHSAATLLSSNGNLRLIFPADRMKDIEEATAAADLFIKSIRPVHRSKDLPPFRVLISAFKKKENRPETLTPLILYRKNGTPTKAHQAIINA